MFFLPKITKGTFFVALLSLFGPADPSAGICSHSTKSEVTLAEASGWVREAQHRERAGAAGDRSDY